MAYVTVEAAIENGRVIPREPRKVPRNGRALITALALTSPPPDWEVIMRLLGRTKAKADGLKIERAARRSWRTREQKQWVRR